MFQDFTIAYMREHVKVRDTVRLSFLRESVAHMLSVSARKIPHAAAVSWFDVTPLVEYGAADGGSPPEDLSDPERLMRRAIRRNFSAFFLKAIAHATWHVPVMNSFLDYRPWRSGGTLYMAEDINLSFTVHTKYGVVKPVTRNPHLKTLEEVAKDMRRLTRKARRTDMNELYRRVARAYMRTAVRQLDVTGVKALWIYLRAALSPGVRPDPELADVPPEDRLQVEDVLGATLTVANIGMAFRGHQTVTVIIPPEVCMLGIGDLHQAPLVVDGEVVPRYVVRMVGTLDHRAADGGDLFPFARELKRYIDHPALIYDWRPGDAI